MSRARHEVRPRRFPRLARLVAFLCAAALVLPAAGHAKGARRLVPPGAAAVAPAAAPQVPKSAKAAKAR